MHSKEFIASMKAKLEGQKAKLEEDLKNHSKHTEMGTDQGENAEEVELDEVNSDVRATFKADLEKIDKALAKIENGTYGIDDDGKEISEERLMALPWADKAL
jgi:RNA polymerase-binding transcription factor DksA